MKGSPLPGGPAGAFVVAGAVLGVVYVFFKVRFKVNLKSKLFNKLVRKPWHANFTANSGSRSKQNGHPAPGEGYRSLTRYKNI